MELVSKTAKGTAVTTSRKIAEIFDKNHKDVLRTIRNLIDSAQNCAQFFASTTYIDSSGKTNEMFVMTRDGFSLVAMGFTGEKAIQWKVKYIDAFNKMEAIIASNQIHLPDFTNPVIAARAWADAEEKRIEAENKIVALAPKASFADRVLEHDNQMVDIGQAAKLLKLPFGRNTFFKRLKEDGIFFKSRNEPKQEYIDRGYFDVRKKDIERNDHPGFTVLKVLVTSKGLYWLSKLYGGSSSTKIPNLQLQ